METDFPHTAALVVTSHGHAHVLLQRPFEHNAWLTLTCEFDPSASLISHCDCIVWAGILLTCDIATGQFQMTGTLLVVRDSAQIGCRWPWLGPRSGRRYEYTNSNFAPTC
jgi:hypothetical protein